MLKEFFGILLNNIYLVIPFMLYVSLHEISKIIAVFLIAFKDDISDEKAKAINFLLFKRNPSEPSQAPLGIATHFL